MMFLVVVNVIDWVSWVLISSMNHVPLESKTIEWFIFLLRIYFPNGWVCNKITCFYLRSCSQGTNRPLASIKSTHETKYFILLLLYSSSSEPGSCTCQICSILFGCGSSMQVAVTGDCEVNLYRAKTFFPGRTADRKCLMAWFISLSTFVKAAFTIWISFRNRSDQSSFP